ncbi:MAG: aminotransferase class V-fold PLP-dependent enzyme, partial [Gammaproteobacteria bacterium]|nr:aminotransferase class V-fold PLP-dependent enzyme [Gammaproteobacteria bacterium]
MTRHVGRHFLQIPGPTNVPDRILRAINAPTIDHRGPDFADLGKEVLSGIQGIFSTENPVIIFPGSGTGAWEAAMVNTLSPGDTIVIFDIGHFSQLWGDLARRLQLNVSVIPGEWGRAPDIEALESMLKADTAGKIQAVCVVHNETSTGVTANIPAARAALDSSSHGALLLVDSISGLGSVEYHHDAWGVDVTICGSQKGLMLPPGLGFNAVSEKALHASKSATLTRAYWDWDAMLGPNANGFFPYTPSTNLLYGLREAIKMLNEEGLENVFARHARLARACRAAVSGWGLDILCPVESERSNVLTTVNLPNSDALRRTILDRFDMSLGAGLGKLT